MTMRRVSGAPLGAHALTRDQVTAVVSALHRLHRCVPEDVLRALPASHNDPRTSLARTRDGLAAQPRPVVDAVVTAAYDTAQRWFTSREAHSLVDGEIGPVVLARGDHNLPNFLWDGQGIRLVDFEDSGQADRCAELAALIEHISARVAPDTTWRLLLDQVALNRTKQRRLLAARRLEAAMWLLLLLPGQPSEHRNPTGALHAQAERLLVLT